MVEDSARETPATGADFGKIEENSIIFICLRLFKAILDLFLRKSENLMFLGKYQKSVSKSRKSVVLGHLALEVMRYGFFLLYIEANGGNNDGTVNGETVFGETAFGGFTVC